MPEELHSDQPIAFSSEWNKHLENGKAIRLHELGADNPVFFVAFYKGLLPAPEIAHIRLNGKVVPFGCWPDRRTDIHAFPLGTAKVSM